VAELILDLVSLDYHETLFAASGRQIEEALEKARAENAGKYILVVEGAVPTAENGVYCKVGGKTAVESLKENAEHAGLVVAIGSCASWGGVAAAEPNPTGAKGIAELLPGRKVVTLPGCPANPYNLLGTVLQFATFGTLPSLDEKGRPKFAYARTIHEDCSRRPHFDAGRFASAFGDEGHRDGYCLYKLGCKGPATHANCSLQPFVEVPGAWPVGIGHPCVGCTEQHVGFRVAMHDVIDIERPTAPATFAPVRAEKGSISPLAVGVTGLVGGAVVGAGVMAAYKVSKAPADPGPPPPKEEVRP
jgi:hydrogenase small subunit